MNGNSDPRYPAPKQASLATDIGLLEELKSDSPDASWQRFFSVYGGLILRRAYASGLSRADADDVLQETMFEVSRRMASFEYRPEQCRFKTWLMVITRSKIANLLRKQKPTEPLPINAEDIVDANFETNWDNTWKQHVAAEALNRVQKSASPWMFQVFQWSHLQGVGIREITRLSQRSRLAIYMANYKIRVMLKSEIKNLDDGNV